MNVDLTFIESTTWGDVFRGWKDREATDPGWIHCATEVKGWPDWDSWRHYTADAIGAQTREWKRYQFAEPLSHVPHLLMGPYGGWQNQLSEKNKLSFQELLDIPEHYARFQNHEIVQQMRKSLPFETEFIGLVREDTGDIVLIDGHHRACAIAFAACDGDDVDFADTRVTIALASIPVAETYIFDTMLSRGTHKPT